ncbi:MAG: hypothetical protein JWP48_1396 [Actinoallomurus sp.]|jgi:hypothetical protein|nr:hypothetical protein [Actinoallomurus sp.]
MNAQLSDSIRRFGTAQATVAAYQLLMTPVGEQDVGLSAEVELRPSADPTAVAVADDVF